jgi:hypothetical protein
VGLNSTFIYERRSIDIADHLCVFPAKIIKLLLYQRTHVIALAMIIIIMMVIVILKI